MITINAQNQKPPTPLSILLIGGPGGGKSTLALQFPNPGVVDIDRNLKGPLEHIFSKNPTFQLRYADCHLDKANNPIPQDQIWSRIKEVTEEMLKDEWIKTIIYDGLTIADDALLFWTMKRQGISDMRRQDWIPFRAEMLQLIIKCRSSQKTFLMLCHEESKENDKGEVERYVPSFRSKVGQYFGGFFTDMWRCSTLPTTKDKLHPEGIKFILETVPTSKRELKKSTMKMPAEIQDVTYEKIAQYL